MDTFINNLIEFACVAYIYALWGIGIMVIAHVWTLFTWKGGKDNERE